MHTQQKKQETNTKRQYQARSFTRRDVCIIYNCVNVNGECMCNQAHWLWHSVNGFGRAHTHTLDSKIYLAFVHIFVTDELCIRV